MKEKGEIIFYQVDSAENQIEVTLSNDTVWLSLNQMADLFGRDKSVISKHLSNVFSEGSWIDCQLLQKMQQLDLMGRLIRLNTLIWT
jgi:hypothetical protein